MSAASSRISSERLEDAYDREVQVLALTIAERESILRARDDASTDLAELRAVLLQEHLGRVRDGLVQAPATGRFRDARGG